jgi:hypothetical protein
MAVDPQVQTILDKLRERGAREYWQMSVAEARDWHMRKAEILGIPKMPVARTEDRAIEGSRRERDGA